MPPPSPPIYRTHRDMNRADLIAAHQDTSAHLADALREMGTLSEGRIRQQAQVWSGLDHLNVTERRETTRSHMVDYDVEVAKLSQEIEALKVELNSLELRIKYASA